MTSGPSALELLILLVPLVGLTLLVIFILARKGSDEGSDRSRAGRAGCVVLVLIGVALIGFWISGLSSDVRFEGEVELVVTCPSAELFVGPRWLGNGEAIVRPVTDAVVIESDVPNAEVHTALFPGAKTLGVVEGSTLQGWAGEQSFTLQSWGVILELPDGTLDSIVSLVFEGSVIGQPSDRRVAVLRARRTGARHLQPGLSGVTFQNSSIWKRLVGVQSPPRYTLEVLMTVLPPGIDPDGERPHVVDRFTVPEAPAPGEETERPR